MDNGTMRFSYNGRDLGVAFHRCVVGTVCVYARAGVLAGAMYIRSSAPTYAAPGHGKVSRASMSWHCTRNEHPAQHKVDCRELT
eukprot:29457-Eustigmatos_ZCMA.PRE.1